MDNTNINLIIKYLAKEDLKAEELKFIQLFKENNSKDFDEIEAAYKANVFTSIPFNADKAFEKVKAYINEDTRQKTINFYQQTWFRVAASILIFLSIGVLALTQYQWEVTLNNSTAKIQEYDLPDGSEIILDKHASINYSRTVFKSFDRKLTLKGRAYFHIKKNPVKQFIVHTAQVDIVVLGTQFTINKQEKNTQVVLTEGVVRLEGKSFVDGKILSIPGAQVLLNDESLLKDNIVSEELYASWTDQIVRFNNCTVNQVFNFLEDSYGISLNVSDGINLNNSLYGSAPSDNPYLIVKAIEEILNTNIEINVKN